MKSILGTNVSVASQPAVELHQTDRRGCPSSVGVHTDAVCNTPGSSFPIQVWMG